MKQQFVSVWVGNTFSEDALLAYTEPVYSDDGNDISSPFLEDFGICEDDFDDDFLECAKQDTQTESLAELLAGCSYDDTVIPALQQLYGDRLPVPCNALIMMYDYKHSCCKSEKSGFRFFGCVKTDIDD